MSMKKLGIIYCGFNTESYIIPSLAPWIKARKDKLGGIEYVICAVSVPFVKFPAQREDKTLDILMDMRNRGDIDLLIERNDPQHEPEIRWEALKMLKNDTIVEGGGCDCFCLVDSDEFYTEDQILRIVQTVQKNPFIPWFKFSFKNYVFNEKTYLVEPFQPARLFRSKFTDQDGEKIIAGFWDDNNVFYARSDVRGGKLSNNTFPSKTIGKNTVWIKHLSWLNDSRSRNKVDYQKSRWGADLCSFQWDDSRGGLCFNEKYFEKMGLPLPEVGYDE